MAEFIQFILWIFGCLVAMIFVAVVCDVLG